MVSEVERILILAKTYPSPSAKYCETSCVAGINDRGLLRRLYPIQFRLIEEGRKFKKWQWITARVEKAVNDHRPESFKIFVDTVERAEMVPSKGEWALRWPWIDRLPSFGSHAEAETRRQETGETLALLRPRRVVKLEIKAARTVEWTDEERAKLVQEQMQGKLFDENEARRQVKELRKIPFDFYYHCVCGTPDSEAEERHKIVDWEVGALYWNCRRRYGDQWEAPFRSKLEKDLSGKDLMFLMGTIHRFPAQWLIVSLIYPPTRKPNPAPVQEELF